jgi:hypothetical protein
MKLHSVAIGAALGAFFLMPSPAAQAQAQTPQAQTPQAQSPQTPVPAEAPAAGKDRSIVSVPSGAANSAAQSAVRAQRDDIARRAKQQEMR